MLRHVISPARNFSQLPNDLIRHTRLSSDAVRLLTWQLSLHPDVPQSLSKTAERAGVKKRAFQRAKAQLLDEGFLHEWREQTDHGHWTTVQLVSTVPLTPDEAVTAREGLTQGATRVHVTAGATAEHGPQAVELNAQVTPGAPQRAARHRTPPAVGTQPRKDSCKNTDHPPPPPHEQHGPHAPHEPEPVEEPERTSETHRAEAELLLRSLARTNPALAVPRRKARDWAPLLAPWLADGLTHGQIRHTLTQGLAEARSPLGVLHWRLTHARPETPPAPEAAPPRLTGMQECEGDHTQPRLCRPRPDAARVLCEECSTAPTTPTTTPPGYLTFRAARAATGRG